MLHRGLVFLFCLSLPAFAQQGAASKEANVQQETPGLQLQASADRHITLDVAVTDRSGKPVLGLQQQDFAVLDNKQPRPIVSFQAVQQDAAAEPPVEVLLLIDAVNTSFTNMFYEREQLKKFLLQNGGKLAQPASLIFFSDQGTEVRNGSTTDGNALLADFDQQQNKLRTITRSQGFYGDVERLQLSLRTLGEITQREANKPGRKLLIWISPGWPILSGPGVDLDRKQLQSLFNSVVEFSRALREAQITLYALDPLGLADAGTLHQTYYETFLKGVTSMNQVQSGNLALGVLAVQSGGLALNSSNDIASEISRAAADATAYYVLSVDTPPAEHPNAYHAIVVKVDKPGVTARTRTGYYAQP